MRDKSEHSQSENHAPDSIQLLLCESGGAIAVYGYLLHIENRETYQSYAGFNIIGRAVKMSPNTVSKYVSEPEEKQLVRPEPTTVITRDGCKRNGTLRYYIRPIQLVFNQLHK